MGEVGGQVVKCSWGKEGGGSQPSQDSHYGGGGGGGYNSNQGSSRYHQQQQHYGGPPPTSGGHHGGPQTPSWRRPKSAAATSAGDVQQPPICYADAAVLRKYGTAVPWRPSSSTTNVPGATRRRAVSRVKPFKKLKEEERKCKLGISVCENWR